MCRLCYALGLVALLCGYELVRVGIARYGAKFGLLCCVNLLFVWLKVSLVLVLIGCFCLVGCLL